MEKQQIEITVLHQSRDGQTYRPVARVTVEGTNRNALLEGAYRLTNHVDRDYGEHTEVEMLVEGGARSTSVGDLLVSRLGVYRVANVGYETVLEVL